MLKNFVFAVNLKFLCCLDPSKFLRLRHGVSSFILLFLDLTAMEFLLNLAFSFFDSALRQVAPFDVILMFSGAGLTPTHVGYLKLFY